MVVTPAHCHHYFKECFAPGGAPQTSGHLTRREAWAAQPRWSNTLASDAADSTRTGRDARDVAGVVGAAGDQHGSGNQPANPSLGCFRFELDAGHTHTVAKTFRLPLEPAPGPFEFVVAIASGRLFSVQGEPAPKFLLVTTRLVAHPADAGSEARSRALSPEEREELTRHARELWQLALRRLAGWIIVGAVAAVRGPQLYRMAAWKAGVAAVFATAGVFATWSLFRALQSARRTRADCEGGRVVRAPIDIDAAAGTVRVMVERLTVTGDIWTVDGQPADWRTNSQIAR